MTRLPVVGPPPRRAWYPGSPDHPNYRFDPEVSLVAARQWRRHFVPNGVGRHDSPPIYWSRRVGTRSNIDALCYRWGIVLSRARFHRRARARRARWLRGVLLHELVHWSGRIRHDRVFRIACQRVGGWR